MEVKEKAEQPAPQVKKRRWLRIALNLALLAFIGIQFVQPDKNNTDVLSRNDISQVVHMPDSVTQLLKIACYDCHSNNTNYPWYTNIQPIGWWMKDHIDEGKQELNFNEFAAIQPKKGKTALQRQIHKLEEIKESVEEGYMPLNSYLWIHTDAKLSHKQKKIIMDWADSSRKSLTLPIGTAQ